MKPASLPAPVPHRPLLGFLPATARGTISAMLLGLNTLFWCLSLFAFALVKLVLPLRPVRKIIDRILNFIATCWIAGNSGWMGLVRHTEWDVQGIDELTYSGWYLVNANHQSWVDILALQHLLNRRIPLLKFFLKQQLIWVPVIGPAWWALDFPFMRRHSPAYLKRHPEKRFDDLETTRRACRKFALVPTSVMNFAEGTRFTTAKHRAQRSPYRHLLKPKAGALALSLNALGGSAIPLNLSANTSYVLPIASVTGTCGALSSRLRKSARPRRVVAMTCRVSTDPSRVPATTRSVEAMTPGVVVNTRRFVAPTQRKKWIVLRLRVISSSLNARRG